MMIDNIGGSPPGLKAQINPQSVRHIREASAQASDTTPSNKAAENVSREAVAAAVKEMNNFIRLATASVEFSVDEDTGRTVVKMIDTETKSVVRQFPSEEALAISKSLDRLQGLTVHVKA